MTVSVFLAKLHRNLWGRIVSRLRPTSLYPILYRSYWHAQITPARSKSDHVNYFAARPNPGAGIGHQLANWIAGYWFAKQFQLRFAHIPFPNLTWESFFGLGQGEELALELIKDKGYKRVLLPLFDEYNVKESTLVQKIIASYVDQKVVFCSEQDQFYKDQYGVISELQQKFYTSPSRQNDQLLFSQDLFNIALHVRRGDIATEKKLTNPNLQMRWQDNDYFLTTLKNVLKKLITTKPIAIYLFSQGKKEDFLEFAEFDNLHFCLEMGAKDSFLHMVFADLLITSKSSFSYKPGLFNKGIKVAPSDFWHGYPPTSDWIVADENGHLDLEVIKPNVHLKVLSS